MIADSEVLYEAALLLPEPEREKLAQRLLGSLTEQQSPEIREAWVAEIRRRVEQLDRGEAETIPGDQVFREVRARLQRQEIRRH